MIIYNVTIKVEEAIAAAWLQWLKQEHIPEVLSTGCFKAYTILRLLDQDEAGAETFAVQYHAENRNDYEKYIDTYARSMREKSFEKWGDRFIAFRSLMEVVH